MIRSLAQWGLVIFGAIFETDIAAGKRTTGIFIPNSKNFPLSRIFGWGTLLCVGSNRRRLRGYS